MKIAVTGATGFVGKRVVQKLLGKGYEVRCIVRRNVPEQKIKNLEFFNAEINAGNMADALKGTDIIVHAAASLSSKERKKTFSVNVDGTKNLLQAAKSCGVKKFVFISSEMAKYPELSFYGKTKLLGEKLVKESGIPFVLFRPTIVFGAGDSRNLLRMIKIIKKLPFCFTIGKGAYKWQPVFVDDLADAIAASIEKKEALGKTFEIGCKEPVAFKALVETVCGEFQWKKPVIGIPKGLLFALAFSKPLKNRIETLSMDRPMDISPAKKILGFNPKSFRESLILVMKSENWV